MSLQLDVRFNFYWEGKVLMQYGSIVYDPPIAKKSLHVRRRVSFNELVNKIFQIMDLDPNRYRLDLTLRTPVLNWSSRGGTYSATLLASNEDAKIIYNFHLQMSNYQAEIYVEAEELLEHGYQLPRDQTIDFDMNMPGPSVKYDYLATQDYDAI
ncbi:hypothetical protein ACH5RR_008935 [Cinchona calisaya]|uniref:Uncharacterized protein n=1 Tax=Cinchona calisaya TaxID=153742 RepID=A0ABD3AEN2_9GENT